MSIILYLFISKITVSNLLRYQLSEPFPLIGAWQACPWVMAERSDGDEELIIQLKFQ